MTDTEQVDAVSRPRRSLSLILSALLFSLAILGTGYAAFGFWTTMLFTSGFLGGFLLWLCLPVKADYARLKLPYWLTLAAFILHRIEEKQAGFFQALSELTGVATPEILSAPVILLVLSSVGAWLLIPYLLKRGYEFGTYLAWTYFTAMGLTELAHFVMPLFTGQPYGYFPGMASVLLLAPLAWWGIYRLVRPASGAT